MKGTNAASPEAYVAALDGWRRTCVSGLRKAVLGAAGLEETLKWGHLVYECNGPVLLIRAEPRRVLFGFWRGQRLREIEPRLKPSGKYEMATLELREGMTVAAGTARRLAKEAAALNGKLGDPRSAAGTARKPARGRAAAKPRAGSTRAPARKAPAGGDGPARVAAYIASMPPPARKALKQLRAAIRAASADITEGISYDIPAFLLDGRYLLYIAAFREHASIYPVTAGMAERHGEAIEPYRSGKATLRFRLDGPIPTALVTQLAKTRVEERRRKT